MIDIIDTRSLSRSWDELDALSMNDDIASDLHDLLLSIQGECKALGSTSAFRSIGSCSGNDNSGDDNIPHDARAAENETDVRGSTNRSNYVALLNDIEGSCRSLQITSPSEKPISDGLEANSESSTENICGENDIEEDRIGSLVAVRCALQSTQARVLGRKKNAQTRRQQSKKAKRQGKQETMERHGNYDSNLLYLIPPELQAKVHFPVEV
mmetsp:Transcript_62631/g.185144  ORF Transcript_62631/g.185144 Transcript_62631/m.185144 type:complete len:211 (-) Transcript_62631:390-1022(-)